MRAPSVKREPSWSSGGDRCSDQRDPTADAPTAAAPVAVRPSDLPAGEPPQGPFLVVAHDGVASEGEQYAGVGALVRCRVSTGARETVPGPPASVRLLTRASV